MTAPGGGDRRRERLIEQEGENELLTTPEVMQAAAPDGAAAWRADARPGFRDLLDAEAIDPNEELADGR